MINRNAQIDYGTSLVPFEYDKGGNHTAVTDSPGVTRYMHDELNRLKQVTDPFTGTVQYRYDAASNRTQTIYPDGKVDSAYSALTLPHSAFNNSHARAMCCSSVRMLPIAR